MSPALVSDVLCAVNLANTGLIARGGRTALAGFALGIAVQPPWAIYGIWTGQYGFVVLGLVYAAIYAGGLHRARQNGSAKDQGPASTSGSTRSHGPVSHGQR